MTVVIAERLAELEDVIDRGRKSFIEVGNALAEIRDRGLYQNDYDTFEDYCQERWGFKKSYSYDLIKGAAVVAELSATADMPLPNSERQARELARLPDAETRQEVWEQAVKTDGANVTAKALKTVVDKVKKALPKVPSLPAKRQQETAKRVEKVLATLPQTSQQHALDTRAWIARRIVLAREITRAKPDAVAPLLDERTSEALRLFLSDMDQWIDRMEDALRPRLTVVGGSDD